QDLVGRLTTAAEVDLGYPVATEGGIENPARGVACHSEILHASVLGDREPSSDNPPISLKSSRLRSIEASNTEIVAHFSGDTECRIYCAITEITHCSEVVVGRRVIGGAHRDNLSVRLE